jgi:hypothetical protein
MPSFASRKACAARLTTRLVLPLMTLPPVILVPGHRPSHDVKCLMVGEARHLHADFRDHGQRGGHVHAVDAREGPRRTF